MMKVLLVYPNIPYSFWSLDETLRFIPQKAYFPPLGLLTVAAMLPKDWTLKLIDMNITSLSDEDIKSADFVFISAITGQRQPVMEVINRCKKFETKIVAGGPLFTTNYEDFDDVDYLVLGEAEATLPVFIADIKNGCAKHLYMSDDFPDLTLSPTPLWSLVNMADYVCMAIQYSRGCPFDCEFCEVTVLNGHKPRTKDVAQLNMELDTLYENGWRGTVFIVDDNFIGNKKKVKTEILPGFMEWSRKRNHRFWFYAQTPINLADDEELMDLMYEVGFTTVFVGIESVNEESLSECGKKQNKDRDLVGAVRKLHNHGLEVFAGFIVGFDNDPESIFEILIEFIQKAHISAAMVGLLNAPRGTRLYQRLKNENRLLGIMSGDNVDCSLNFVPKMNTETLINGHKYVMKTIYSHRLFYSRAEAFLNEYKIRRSIAGEHNSTSIINSLRNIARLSKILLFLGIISGGRFHFWKLLVSNAIRRPDYVPIVIILSMYGFHFNKLTKKLSATLS